MELSTNQKLAVITAMEKWVKDAKADIRAQADSEIYEQYEAFGTEKVGLTLNGQKVGDFIVNFAAEGFYVSDQAAFEDFALGYGLATIRKKIRDGMMGSAIAVIEGAVEPECVRDFIVEEVSLEPDWDANLVCIEGKVVLQDSGLEVPGVSFRPRAVKGTQVRGCKPVDVIPLIRALPGGVEALLLGGGE